MIAGRRNMEVLKDLYGQIERFGGNGEGVDISFS